MPSALDERMDAAIAAITGPGGAVEAVGDGDGRMSPATLPQTLPAFFDLFCERHGDKTAIVMGDERLSFAEVGRWGNLAARALAARGIRPGDRVGLAMPNAPAWIILYIAIVRAGGIAVLINGWWQPGELLHGLDLTTPKLVLADAERTRRCAATEARIEILDLPIDRPIAAALAPLLDGVADEIALPTVHADDDATILFTSGSTGQAKGAVSTHAQATTGTYTYLSYTAALYDVHVADHGEPPFGPATLVGVPLFHVTGEVPIMLNSFALGRKLVLMRRWDAGEALRLIPQERITYFIGVPTMSLEMMQHPDRARHDVTSLMDIAAGGAARPVAHVPRLIAAFPRSHPMMGYGLTETNAVGCTNFRASYLARPASAGRCHRPWVDIAVFDAAGRRLPRGETGEIGILSRANIRGYWRDEAATRKAFTAEGHVLTGDLGYLDADGYVFIVDRAKDIIIRGGENISCLEVEAAIYAHPAVAEASVFGLPDDRLGEVPAAVVALEADMTLDHAALDAFLSRRLASYKQPVQLWIEPLPLPKLGTGKIDKKTLRTRFQAKAAAESVAA